MQIAYILISCVLTVLPVPGIQGADDDGIYKIGTGIGDITGPPAGVVLNGYVNPLTYAAGIYTRQFARAFVVESLTTHDRVVFVTCDLGMMDHSIKTEAIKKLQLIYPDGRYTHKNVMISATHTHSGVSGFMTHYAYLIIESYGFNPLTFWSIVDGVVESIVRATDSAVEGRMYYGKKEILNANRNRQSTAYMANPPEEIAAYKYDVDKDILLLKMESLGGEPLGAFTWWPVHPISFNDWDNPLVTSDNKGYASLLFDYKMNPGKRPGSPESKFVAGFGSSNLGDVSPNHSEGKINMTDPISKVNFVGTKQFDAAYELFMDSTLPRVTGSIKFAHQFVDTETVQVEVTNQKTGQLEALGLCKAALGYSYVGLDPEWSWLWDSIRDIIKTPSETMIECQKPKLVALPAGEMTEPWEWSPSIVALQILRIGNFEIVGAPGEYTTMSGRRLRNAICNITGSEVAIAGLANNYINYITTPEEYDTQEYEAGATIYGRNTLPVTIAIFEQMARALQNGDAIPDGPTPPSFLEHLRTEIDQRVDKTLGTSTLGSVVVQPNPSYTVAEGGEVTVVFNAASPRHSPMRGGTFFVIEKQNVSNGEWEISRTDADIDTTFWWNVLLNRAEVKWYIPLRAEAGTYRVRHFGFHLAKLGDTPRSYYGTSRSFQLV